MKDVFGSIPLVASSHPSSISVNEARAPFVSIQNDQRLLSHEDSKFS